MYETTINDILHFNLPQLLTEDEIESDLVEENGKVKYIGFKYELRDKELSTFDMLTVRLFSGDKSFRKYVQTHITLTSSTPTGLSEVMAALDKILKIYGPDNHGSTMLSPHEVHEIENNKIWNGRNWWFNESHQPWDSNNGEAMSYMVFLDSKMNETGLALHINHYNILIDYFTDSKT